MKKIFTLIAVMFSITAFAAPGPKTSKISISNNDRSKIQVKIDGKMYDLNNSFVMDNVRAGNHSIAIYKTDNVGFRRTTKMIYNNSMFVTPGQLIDVNINRGDKVTVTTSSNNDRFGRDDRNNRNDRGYNDRNNNNRDNNYGRH
ncbi:MAG TPA: hypothetical protein VIM79_10485 [Niastella sp.]